MENFDGLVCTDCKDCWIVELSKVAFPKGSFPLNKVFNCQYWHFTVNIAHIYWDHKSYKSIFLAYERLHDCTIFRICYFLNTSKWTINLRFRTHVRCIQRQSKSKQRLVVFGTHNSALAVNSSLVDKLFGFLKQDSSRGVALLWNRLISCDMKQFVHE